MNRLFLVFLLCYSINLNSQIVEVWKESRPYGVYFDFSEMRIVGSNIYIHSITELANSFQYAQSITTDGDENWFTIHDQFDECFDCVHASVEDVVFNSLGESFAVGQQGAFPFSGRYFSKISAAGEIAFANEFLTNPWSSGFEEVCLSADESFLFASGYQFAPEINTLGVHLYKLSLDGQIVDSRFLGGQLSSIYRLTSSSSNQIFANDYNNDTLRFACFDSTLELNWLSATPISGYSGGAIIDPIFLSNGDLLFINYLNDNNQIGETILHFTRITQTGNIVWQSQHDMSISNGFQYYPKDVVVDASGNIFCYFNRVINTGGKGGGSGGLQERPVLFKFDNQGVFQWSYVEQANSTTEFSTVYIGNVIVDENGYSIISAFQDPFENEGVTYTILKPSGNVETTIYIDDFNEFSGKEMIYAGNRTFYSHTIARNLENPSESSWVVARYQYDISTNIASIEPGNDFVLYPNPASDFVTIKSNQEIGSHLFKITDITGRTVREFFTDKSSKTIVAIEELSAGMYLVSNGIKTIQMVVN